MALRLPAKRKTSFRAEEHGEFHHMFQQEEKTIPFLRRLTDMLQENNEVISFIPGVDNGMQTSLGQIVVHDRARVESDVLPKYFNHASFASLRRQLNYFSFTRIGKGRQRGATYCNEGVIELDDILRLKRRAVGTAATNQEENAGDKHNQHAAVPKSSRGDVGIASVVPFVHLPTKRERSPTNEASFTKRKKSKKSRCNTAIISPLSTSPEHTDDEQQHQPYISLDLTTTLPTKSHHHKVSTNASFLDCHETITRDEDILAGCNVLLSFSSAFGRPVVGKS